VPQTISNHGVTNSVEGIPHPLLNRMAVYEVPAPTPEQAAGIAQRMYKGLLKELNLGGFDPLLGMWCWTGWQGCRRGICARLYWMGWGMRWPMGGSLWWRGIYGSRRRRAGGALGFEQAVGQHRCPELI
jgi:hypothetical protein